MPGRYELVGIDDQGGQALFQEVDKDKWFHVSIDDAWQPRELPDVAEAMRLSCRSPILLSHFLCGAFLWRNAFLVLTLGQGSFRTRQYGIITQVLNSTGEAGQASR